MSQPGDHQQEQELLGSPRGCSAQEAPSPTGKPPSSRAGGSAGSWAVPACTWMCLFHGPIGSVWVSRAGQDPAAPSHAKNPAQAPRKSCRNAPELQPRSEMRALPRAELVFRTPPSLPAHQPCSSEGPCRKAALPKSQGTVSW